MSTTYLIEGFSISADHPDFQSCLEKARLQHARPLCLCKTPHPEMYIAKVAGKFYVKRMPSTGVAHASSCDSYEPPPELSGLGQVMGQAIVENPEDGTTKLKLDFSMSKIGSRAAPTPTGKETDTVKTDGNKLTLRGLLHLLWEQSGLNRWSPAMENKRSWYVVRKNLLKAADDKVTKQSNLADLIFIPEAFHADKKEEIKARRLAKLAPAAYQPKGKQLMILVGEVKLIEAAKYGHKIVIKQMPDFPFFLNEDVYSRLLKRFAIELATHEANDEVHLITIATFSLGITGVANIEEMSLMLTTANWIPFDNMHDLALIDSMTNQKRRFVKGLRYYLPSATPLACMVATDVEPPVGMYIIPPGASDSFIKNQAEMIEASQIGHWEWNAAAGGLMPPLPQNN